MGREPRAGTADAACDAHLRRYPHAAGIPGADASNGGSDPFGGSVDQCVGLRRIVEPVTAMRFRGPPPEGRGPRLFELMLRHVGCTPPGHGTVLPSDGSSPHALPRIRRFPMKLIRRVLPCAALASLL